MASVTAASHHYHDQEVMGIKWSLIMELSSLHTEINHIDTGGRSMDNSCVPRV